MAVSWLLLPALETRRLAGDLDHVREARGGHGLGCVAAKVIAIDPRFDARTLRRQGNAAIRIGDHQVDRVGRNTFLVGDFAHLQLRPKIDRIAVHPDLDLRRHRVTTIGLLSVVR